MTLNTPQRRGRNNDNLSGYGVLRQASGVERLAKCRVFAINPSDGEKRVIHSNPRRTFSSARFYLQEPCLHGEGFSHESRVSRSEVQNRKPSLQILGFAFRNSSLVSRYGFLDRGRAACRQSSMVRRRMLLPANQLSLSTSQTPASTMMATDPTGTKTRLYSAVSRAR